MDFINTITNSVTNYLYLALLKKLDVETLRNILAVGVSSLMNKAEQTETKLDDWAVEALADFIKDDAKMQIVVDWIKSKAEGILCSDAPERENDYQELAQLAMAADNEPASSVEVIAIVAQVFEVVLPLVIEWWKKQKGEETETRTA